MQRLRSHAGFTLPELLVAMAIGMLTVLAVVAILETSMKQSNAIAGRVNATQRGRIAMDAITRQLRSQVCLSATVPAIISGDDDAVKFYVDLSNGTKPIEKRELRFDATKRTIREVTWVGSPPPLTFPATATKDRLLLDDVYRRSWPGEPTEIFRYYAFNTATPPQPILRLPTPLSLTDAARVARIETGFTTLPPRAKPSPASSATLQNEIYVRVADPNDPAPTPTCA